LFFIFGYALALEMEVTFIKISELPFVCCLCYYCTCSLLRDSKASL